MNVQCAVLVVQPALYSEDTSSISVEANFFFSQTFVMDKECTMIVLSTTTSESAEGARIKHSPACTTGPVLL